MTRHTLSLDGPGWAVREALGETWRWYVDRSADADATATGAPAGTAAATDAATGTPPGGTGSPDLAPGWWPAAVPGSVVTDLVRAGELPDPYRGRDSRA